MQVQVKLVDTHCHLTSEEYSSDIVDVIERARNSCSALINISYDIDSSLKGIEFVKKYNFIWTSVGIHPHDTEEIQRTDYEMLIKLAQNDKVVAIGETGLDFYKMYSSKEKQKESFLQHIEIAKALKLPLVVHCRNAQDETYKIISKNGKGMKIIFHCFSGDVNFAKRCIKNDYYISVAGPITYENAKKIVEVVKYIPLNKMLIETDCPYLTPCPFRGKRNEPSYIRYIAEKIAEIKNIPFFDIAEIVTKNAKEVFGLK